MLSKVLSLGLSGVNGYEVQTECYIGTGLPAFDLVGLPDASVKEARERVRAAIKNCGFRFPVSRIIVNLAPAGTKKSGTLYDLPILLSILAASEQVKLPKKPCAFLGELSLEGVLRAVPGVLPMALAAKRLGYEELYVPEDNAREATLAGGLTVYGVKDIRQLTAHLTGQTPIDPAPVWQPEQRTQQLLDFKDVKGQENAKRALEIAAAGGHNILLVGPPGSGKSMLSKRLPSILPDMTRQEQLDVTQIYSVMGLLRPDHPLIESRPFRSPHTKEDDTLTPEELEKQAQEAFYTVFWELDRSSMEAYLAEHPDTLANGWDHIYINEAGFDDEGTSIQSIFGEQVLAIDAKDGVLLLRISGKGYRGVLAVGKDPSLLSIEMASTLGTAGQLSGTIAEAHNGVLAMNANGFLDPNGAGNGGLLAGYTMSNGTAYGDHFSAYAYKRIELHEDNLFYIKDALSSVSEDCTDAAEFTPALIVDGKKIMDDYWTGEQPRACIGQSENYEILMLVIEGRYPLEGILGTSVNNCSEILLQHKCMQAINLDGGSSAMLWFDGEYVTQSSSSPLRYTGGRPLPNAWVYKKAQ